MAAGSGGMVRIVVEDYGSILCSMRFWGLTPLAWSEPKVTPAKQHFVASEVDSAKVLAVYEATIATKEIVAASTAPEAQHHENLRSAGLVRAVSMEPRLDAES